MSGFAATPPQLAAYEASLPGPYVGERWATFRSPLGVPVEIKVAAVGQIATPNAKPHLVAYQMWNYLPLRGKGWKYIGWRVKPYGPAPSFPTKGKVTDEERAELAEILEGIAGR